MSSPVKRHVAVDFFDEAMAVLSASGFPALTANGLCNRMGLTRGSFYHHFESFDDFVDQLLTYWEEHFSRDLIARSTSADLMTQARMQAEFAVDLPHEAEAALRAWGTVNQRVADALHEVDRLRHRELVASLRRHGVTARRAETYATIALTTLVGMQVSQRPFDRAALRKVYRELATALGANLMAP